MALHITQVLIKPLITEKNNVAREVGNVVVFEVHHQANKRQIQHAVEQLFGVKVEAVNTIWKRGKARRVGKWSGFRTDQKKASVTIAAGQNIDFYQTA